MHGLNILNDDQDEELSKDYDYNNSDFLFEYHNPEDFTKQKSLITIDETPIFISSYSD